MVNLAKSMNEVLPDFQKFLLRNMSNAPKSPLDALYEKP